MGTAHKCEDCEARLTRRIVELAGKYGRYGYRRITALLWEEGWCVNHKLVERIWRQEDLKVPKKQPKRGSLWFNDGSCIRLRAEHPNHVWSYDFVFDRTHDGKPIRMLTIVDEWTRECLAIDVERNLNSESVLERLAALFVRRGTPAYLRSDNGSEFTAQAVRDWLRRVNVGTLFIERGSPWENGYIESFNGKLRDESPERRDLLHAEGGQGLDRAVAARVQPDPAAQLARIPPAGTRNITAKRGIAESAKSCVN